MGACLALPVVRVSPADAAVLACVLRHALRHVAQTGQPLCHALGLTPAELATLVSRYPELGMLSLSACLGQDAGEDTPEEPDLRQLMLDHTSHPFPPLETHWMAALVARACQGNNHLWQDLGLESRQQLSALLTRHFAPLVRANIHDMKWKKFFYRQLCERAGLPVCPAPRCDACADRRNCFGPEE